MFIMLKNYLKTAFRAMYRDKWYSLVNIGGLAIGMCVALLLGLYVKFELSFDKFHKDYDKIYRLHNHFTKPDLQEERLPCTLYETGEELMNQMPDIEGLARLFFGSSGAVNIKGESKSSKVMIYTDSSFFTLFNFPIVQGSITTPIDAPNQIAISERVANEWFGNENPIGQSVEIYTLDIDSATRSLYRKPQSLNVSAVFSDIPKNSHIRFDVVTNFSTMSQPLLRGQGQDFFTYVKFYNSPTKEIFAKIGEINASIIERNIGSSRPKEHTKTVLIPLHKIHLAANYPYDQAITSNSVFVLTLGIVGTLVLIIASINFINLSTARADKRKREVGIRKSVGSNRSQIIVQFIGESILASLLALVISLTLIELLIVPFNNLLSTSLSLDYKQNIGYFALVVSLAVIVGIIGGCYPSFYVSRFKPITILRGLSESGKPNRVFKSTLIILQFGIAALLIFSLLVINSQMQFIKKKDLGFDKENLVIFFGVNESLIGSYKAVKDDISSIPGVISVSAAQSLPSGGSFSGMNLYLQGADPSSAFSIKELRVQDNYIGTTGMQIISGRDFLPDSPSDNEGFIINETAAKSLGLDNPIDARVVMWKRPGKIIGVIKDFHFASLRDNIEPLIITRYNPRMHNFTIRIEDSNKQETISKITSIIQKHEPNYKSSYVYLSDYLNTQYGAEEKTFRLILSASALALLLSMIGLYALSAYSLACRTKELGVRKILGASLPTLLRLLLTDSTKWVLVANIIALPIGWYLAKDWLNDFAYRIDISPWIFISAIVSTYLIAMLTIAWQVLQAARTNPVNALRYE